MKPARAVEESAVLKPILLIINLIPQHPRKPPRKSLSRCVGTGVMVYPVEYMPRKSATLGLVPRVLLNNDKNLDMVIQPNYYIKFPHLPIGWSENLRVLQNLKKVSTDVTRHRDLELAPITAVTCQSTCQSGSRS